MTTCANCGRESPEPFKFCPECGAPAEAPAPAREVRKVVTIVFCDLTGSTALGDRTDPETLRATMRGYYEEMRAILERHGGTVEKFVGDAVMAVFGVPVSHEDDALRAVRAAWEMRAAVTQLGLQARIGVNTGEVVTGEGDTLVTGDAVNVAARLEQAAEPGDVLIGSETHRHVRDAATVEPIEVTAKGKPGRVDAFRMLDLDVNAAGISRRLDTALVGRERELSLLKHAYDRAVGERSCQLVTVLGSAGVGKSRLVAEFLEGLDATVIRGRCLDYGEGITFWPVVEVLKQLGATETIESIANGFASSGELFWAVRSVFEETAAVRPLVVVFDDIHWGEPTFLDLLDHVADLSRGVPILLLCVARPELLDGRPGWGGGKLNTTTTLLEPLTSEQSAELLRGLGDDGVDDAVRARIIERADGNPLFVEEMLALARDGGDIRAPSTIQALQARLDRLGAAERAVIERGAVEGEIFHRLGAEALSGSSVDLELVGLVRKELIRPDRTVFVGDHAFRFRHLLIRDAAYEGLAKEARADLHERFAHWLGAREDLVELDEILGYHLEQAALYRRELGHPIDGARAGEHLAEAGRRAFRRDDSAAAANLLERALALLPPEHPARTVAALALAETASLSGHFERHDELLAPLLASDDLVTQANAKVVAAATRFHRDPTGASENAQAVLAEALPLLEAAKDADGLARAAVLAFWPNLMVCNGRAASSALRRAIMYARAADDGKLEGFAAQFLAVMASYTGSASELDGIAEELQAGGTHGAVVQCAIEVLLGCKAMLRGDAAEARLRVAENNRLLTELGWDIQRHGYSLFGADVEEHAGNPAGAVTILSEAAEQLVELDSFSYASTAYAILGQTHYELGDRAAAAAYCDRCDELTAPDDLINFAIVNGLRARLAADAGEHDTARELAVVALDWALRSDFQFVRANAYRDSAHVRAAAGDREGARSALEAALEEYRAKEDEPMIARVEQLLVEL